MIISVHVNGEDVDHDLTDDDVDGDQQTESDAEAVVSLEVFDCFFGEEDGLFIDDEAIHENHASPKERIKL